MWARTPQIGVRAHMRFGPMRSCISSRDGGGKWQTRAMTQPVEPPEREAQDEAITAYWQTARKRAGFTRLGGIVGQQALDTLEPPAWSFGADPEEADELLELVLAGMKTAISSAAAPYVERGEPLPEAGGVSIILDGVGRPRALIVTEAVAVIAYGSITAEDAAAEGEGDLSLAHWRAEQEPYFRAELAAIGQELSDSSEIVIEYFKLLDPRVSKS